jgi:RNA polymerase sigma factor (sigma-70 family)
MEEFLSCSDTEVIQKILHGKSEVFEILIRRMNPVLYKTGRSYGYNHEDTQDLMQETFISAYLNLSKFESRSTFKTWIIKIMLNNCFHKYQKFSFKNERVTAGSIHEKSSPMYSENQHNDPNKTLLNRELNQVIENSLKQIPVEYRMVFSLREINGLSMMETSEVLDISEANVKVRLHRAKAMLRREIEKVYTTEDLFEFNLLYCDNMVKRVMSKLRTDILPHSIN